MTNNIVPQSNQGLAQTGDFQRQLQEALNMPLKSRPYTAQITRATPSAFVFLLDQSGSMEKEIPFQNEQIPKSEAVARIVNETLREIINRCQKTEGIRDYLEVALIGYGLEKDRATCAWQGPFAGRDFVKPSELQAQFLEEKTVEETKVIRGKTITSSKSIKTWLHPLSKGLTPMNSALNSAAELLEKWIVAQHGRDIFPPIVINITDGEATDAKAPELLKSALRIKALHTTDGHVLLLNIHLSEAGGQPVLFPQSLQQLPDDNYARLLYDMSSEMPSIYNADIARLTGMDSSAFFTGMAYNADAKALVNMVEIGTNTAMGRTTDANHV